MILKKELYNILHLHNLNVKKQIKRKILFKSQALPELSSSKIFHWFMML
jgi:hypothetical protein